MSALEFVGQVGRHFRMGTMLLKDSVKGRLGTSEGLSFTEFTYQIFQVKYGSQNKWFCFIAKIRILN